LPFFQIVGSLRTVMLNTHVKTSHSSEHEKGQLSLA
jgi:hypothetical protein